jgi:hypothetical protein
MSDYNQDREECRQAAIRAGALRPQGFKEEVLAGWLGYYQGQSFENTPLAQGRLNAWTDECMRGKGYSV